MVRAALALILGAMPAIAGITTASPGGTPGGVEYVSYSIPGSPPSGLSALSYSLTVLQNADPRAAWYWADTVSFVGDGSVAYFGLQPNGQYGLTALFSVFGPGTVGIGSGCADGADGGPGTSCHIPYAWQVGRTYLFTIALQSQDVTGDTWLGTVQDQTSAVSTTIGAWRVGSSRGLLTAQLGFAEYFGAVDSCASLPQMVVNFGAPTGRVGSQTLRGIVTGAYGHDSTGGTYLPCGSVASAILSPTGALVQAPVATYRARPTASPSPSVVSPPSATPTSAIAERSPYPYESASGLPQPTQPSLTNVPGAIPGRQAHRPAGRAGLLMAGVIAGTVALVLGVVALRKRLGGRPAR